MYRQFIQGQDLSSEVVWPVSLYHVQVWDVSRGLQELQFRNVFIKKRFPYTDHQCIVRKLFCESLWRISGPGPESPLWPRGWDVGGEGQDDQGGDQAGAAQRQGSGNADDKESNLFCSEIQWSRKYEISQDLVQ